MHRLADPALVLEQEMMEAAEMDLLEEGTAAGCDLDAECAGAASGRSIGRGKWNGRSKRMRGGSNSDSASDSDSGSDSYRRGKGDADPGHGLGFGRSRGRAVASNGYSAGRLNGS